MQYGVIMAGGAGLRLWPMSRSGRPKQLLEVVQGKSLLQLSYERLRGLLPPERIYVCTGEAYRRQVLENLPELPPENLLGEPEGRDTANAIGFSAAVLLKNDKDAVAAFVTADHVIEPFAAFHAAMRTGFAAVAEMPKALVTFGIRPTHGHTGLGYIRKGEEIAVSGGRTAYKVLEFYEKPEKEKADAFVESERWYWNSGMFVWRCDTVLGELARNLPESSAGLMRIREAWGGNDVQRVLAEVYPKLKKISIDYAVMEPASKGRGAAEVVVVEMPVKWLDVGSWPALADTLATDERDNATQCANCVLLDSNGNIIISDQPEHLLAAIGINDMIIVHTRDATLICPKNEAQRVKDLVQRVRERYSERYT